MRTRIPFTLIASSLLAAILPQVAAAKDAARRPNILLAIADDQSYPYCSIYGDTTTKTPAFDRIAKEGVLFANAFCASPGCSPSRAALLTGRHTWQLQQAGTHASSFPKQYVTYPDRLEQAGYHVGYTGKGWGPGNWKVSGRTRNPAGPAWQKRKLKSPKGISNRDYAANFADFLKAKKKGQPFCFWYGGHEPHRSYLKGAGLKAGKKRADARVPSFLPDTPEIRSDLLDYAFEIEWFDSHLMRMIQLLEERGELDNTLIVVTADNGMPFPRAKANGYEYGIHVPIAVRWPKAVKGGRKVTDLVGFVDLAPTFLDAAGLKVPAAGVTKMSGRSLMNVLRSDKSGRVDPSRTRAFSARERHSSSRYKNRTYPIRSMRTDRYLYIRNFRPQRWPAGAPQKYAGNGELGPMHGGYHDIDACPSLTFLIENRDKPAIKRFFHLAVDKRPAEELYDVQADPGNLWNLATDSRHAETLARLRKQMLSYLKETGDPRVIDGGDVYETYKRYSRIRRFPPPGRSTSKKTSPPNVIFILTDDQRYDALGCMGNPVLKTPHIDALAKQGVLFRNMFCTTSICAVSRATFMTGQYSRRHGIHGFRKPLTAEQFGNSFPGVLRKRGYRTGIVGKWGLGGKMPRDKYDYFRGYRGQGRYFPRGKSGQKGVHLTHKLGDQALEFLDGCDADKPFLLQLYTKAAHCQDGDPWPFQPDPRYNPLYADATIPRAKTADEAHFKALPPFLKTSEARNRWRIRFANEKLYQKSVKDYYRLINGIDDVVGRLRNKLKQKGLAGNTVIIYTSDNGFYLGEHGLAGKWFMHEESIRLPLIIYDPRLPQKLRGRTVNELVLSIDIAPTIDELAGAKVPKVVQGKSLLPLVRDEKPHWRTDFFYEHLFKHARIPQTEGVRTERWKYTRYISVKPQYEELFDLKTDPLEETNLAKNAKYAAVLKRLRRRCDELAKEVQ